MSIYNFSSTDPEHYNRIRVNIPNHFLTRFVNVCVSTFVSNCNIEVMNKDDYIEFEIDGARTKVFMASESKVDASSLVLILQDIFDDNHLKITVFLTDIDTIEFLSEVPFSITDMSYNMKLLLGFYCVEDSKYPIKSVEFDDKVAILNRDKPATRLTYYSLSVGVGETKALQPNITPVDARGYTIVYEYDTEYYSIENGYLTGVASTAKLPENKRRITAKLYNPGSDTSGPYDLKVEITAWVLDLVDAKKMDFVDVCESISLLETDTYIIVASPEYAVNSTTNTETWTSEDASIATVDEKGKVKGIKPGETVIHYTYKNMYRNDKTWEWITQTFEKRIKVKVISKYAYVKRNHILADSVGYKLSTPILYLLTNIGSHVFFNEMNNQQKLQCGTVCMCLMNSYSASFPIISQQGEIITRCALTHTSDVYFILVDANMREVKLLNPMYITVSITPDQADQPLTPGILAQ